MMCVSVQMCVRPLQRPHPLTDGYGILQHGSRTRPRLVTRHDRERRLLTLRHSLSKGEAGEGSGLCAVERGSHHCYGVGEWYGEVRLEGGRRPGQSDDCEVLGVGVQQ